MSLLKRIRIRISPNENTAESRIFYDDALGILREDTAVVQIRYLASPTIVLRKTKRALRNKNNESTEHKAQGTMIVG